MCSYIINNDDDGRFDDEVGGACDECSASSRYECVEYREYKGEGYWVPCPHLHEDSFKEYILESESEWVKHTEDYKQLMEELEDEKATKTIN